MMRGGDDFEDDFVVDELVALSEDEGVAEGLDEEFVAQDSSAEQGSDEDQDEVEEHIKGSLMPANATATKKRKRREKEKERKAKKRKLLELNEAKPPGSMAAQSPVDLAQYLLTLQKQTLPDLSTLELDDISIPESCITDTTSWTKPRTLDHLVDFITEVLPTLHTRLSQKSKSAGAPTLLFVTSAALRVADVTRVLKDKRLRSEKAGEIAKLFAKHFKVAEHVTYLKQTKVAAAAGTPGRIGKLLCETESLSISAMSHIILDTSFRDSKNRTLFDIPETRDEVFKSVLGAPQMLKAIKEGKVHVVLF